MGKGFFFLGVIFCGAGDGTQGLLHARQVPHPQPRLVTLDVLTSDPTTNLRGLEEQDMLSGATTLEVTGVWP